MPNGPWTAYSGGFQNGMTLAITPKNVVLRDNSLKPLLQCINYVILKIFKIETFWSTLMAKFMLLGVIGMCSINFMQKKNFFGGSCILTDTKFMECTFYGFRSLRVSNVTKFTRRMKQTKKHTWFETEVRHWVFIWYSLHDIL